MKYKKLLLLIPLFALAACGTHEEPSSSLEASSSSQVASSTNAGTSSSVDSQSSGSTNTTDGEGEGTNTGTTTPTDDGNTGTDTPTGDNEGTDNPPVNPPVDNSHRAEIVANIKNVKNLTMDLNYSLSGHFLSSQTYPMSDFDYEMTVSNITKYESDKKVSIESSGNMKSTYGTDELIAKNGNVFSTRTDVYNMLSGMGYEFSEEKDTFWMEQSRRLAKSYLGYDETAKQYYSYQFYYDDEGNIDHSSDHARYIEDEYTDDETEFDRYATLIFNIIKDGIYDESKHSFTLASNQGTTAFVEELFDYYFEHIPELDPSKVFTSFILTVENDQIKQLEMKCGADFLKIYSTVPEEYATIVEDTYQASYVMAFQNINSTVISDFPAETPACDNHESVEMIKTEEYHRLKCNECGKYLTDKTEHSIAAGDNQFCTDCGLVLGLGDRVYEQKYLLDNDYKGSGSKLYLLSYQVGKDGLKYDSELCCIYDTDVELFGSVLNELTSYDETKYYYSPSYHIVLTVSQETHYVKEHNCQMVFARTYSLYRDVEVINGIDHGYEFEYGVGSTPLNEYIAVQEPDAEDLIYYVGISHNSGEPQDEIYSGCIHKLTQVCERCGEATSTFYRSQHVFDNYRILTDEEREQAGSFSKESGTIYCAAHCSVCDKEIIVSVNLTGHPQNIDHLLTQVNVQTFEMADKNNDAFTTYSLTVPHILDTNDNCVVCDYLQTNDQRTYAELKGTGYEVKIGNRYLTLSQSEENVYRINDVLLLTGQPICFFLDGSPLEVWAEADRYRGYYPNYVQLPRDAKYSEFTVYSYEVSDIELRINNDSSYSLWIYPEHYAALDNTGYYIVINGERYCALDYNGKWSLDNSFDEYSNTVGLELEEGDVISFYDSNNKVGWSTGVSIDPSSEGELTTNENGIVVGNSGTYDIYFKMKNGADNIYLGNH